MEKIQKSTPALRFRDGQGNSYPDWEERKLGQIFTVRYGKEHKKLSDGNVPVIGTGGVIRYANGVLYSEPSVLIGRKGTIDKPQFINQPFWAVDTVFFTEIEPSNVSYFVFLIVSKINWKRYNEASGLPSLSANTIKGIRVNIPSKEEQQKIANFLSSVDTKIEQLSEKKELLELYKKGMMQKLFSQEIRFKDEQGNDYLDWEEKTLGEVAKFYSGGTPETTKKQYYTGNIPFIKSGEIAFSSTEQFISDEGLNNSSAKIVKKGDILYALYGATSGEVAVSKINGAINQAVLCIRSDFSHDFIYFYLNFKKDAIVSTYIQGGQGNLSAKIVKFLKINFPSLEEQQKIANFLSAIDKKIELVAEQLEQARTFKKGLLQRMFI